MTVPVAMFNAATRVVVEATPDRVAAGRRVAQVAVDLVIIEQTARSLARYSLRSQL